MEAVSFCKASQITGRSFTKKLWAVAVLRTGVTVESGRRSSYKSRGLKVSRQGQRGYRSSGHWLRPVALTCGRKRWQTTRPAVR